IAWAYGPNPGIDRDRDRPPRGTETQVASGHRSLSLLCQWSAQQTLSLCSSPYLRGLRAQCLRCASPDLRGLGAHCRVCVCVCVCVCVWGSETFEQEKKI